MTKKTSTKERTSFSDFGRKFQEKLVKIIVKDKVFSDQIREVLDVNFFEQKYLQAFVGKIFEYKEQYGSHPTPNTIETILRTDLNLGNELLEDKVREFFIQNWKSNGDDKIADSSFVKEKAIDFCKKQKLKEAMIKSIDCLEKSSFNEINILINDALKLGLDTKLGHEFIEDFEQRYIIEDRSPISFGWDAIDAITGGGLGEGELGVVIAPTGTGKTHLLIHLGAQALKANKNVAHYTLELSDSQVGRRYDSCLTGVPLDDLYSVREFVLDKIREVPGKLTIKQYPTKTASTMTIRNHLDKLISRGTKPDMVIVDYGDLIKPNVRYKEKRTELESIYEELRAIAEEYEVKMWTASQTNRSGLNAEVITMEAISEAYNKCFVADFIFSLSRTIEDKNNNTGRIFIAKSRLGPDGYIFPIFMDASRVKIEVFDQRVAMEEKEMESEGKSSKEMLAEKYKKHMKKKKQSKIVQQKIKKIIKKEK